MLVERLHVLELDMARDTDEVAVALSMALAYDREAIVERLVDGRDLAVSLIEVDGALVALPVVEARPRERSFYDFEARYTPGATVFDAPADLPAGEAGEAQRLAVAACELLGLRAGCAHASRPDARCSGGRCGCSGEFAVPGMTDTQSLFFRIAAQAQAWASTRLVRGARAAGPRSSPTPGAAMTSPFATRARTELSSSPCPAATSRSSCSATSRVTAIGSP